MANEFRVRKKLIVNGSGSTILDVQGSQGQLFSITDSLSGSLFSVKDISGIPVMEAFSDDTVNIGTFNAEAIKVSGSFARITGSLLGTASVASNAVTASSADNFLVRGTLTAQTIVAQTITSSTDFITGSTRFGSLSTDTHQFTGSLSISGSSPLIRLGSTSFVGDFTTPAVIIGSTSNGFYLDSNRINFKAGGSFAGGFSSDGILANQILIRGTTPNDLTTAMYIPYRLNAIGLLAGLGGNDTGAITLITSGSTRLYVSSSGNVGIGTTTPTQRLQVNGDTLMIGSGNTSATAALLVENSDGSDLLRVRNDGTLILGAFSESPSIYPSTTLGALDINGASITYYIRNGFGGSGRHVFSGATKSGTSGFGSLIEFIQSFTPVSGTGVYSMLNLTPTISQSGGANGITRGINVSPTLTSAWDFRAIEWSNNASATSGSWGLYGAGSAPNYLSGSLSIGTTAISSSVTVNGSIFSNSILLPINGNIGLIGTSTRITFENTGLSPNGIIYNVNNTGNPHKFQQGGVEVMRIAGSTGALLLGSATDDAINRLQVSGSARISQALTASQALISGSGTQRLVVVGSGSAQPIFTVQGSQGELFSIVDSLSGSLFSVNDQSGLPIMEVFSDSTILMGNYLDPMLLTTTKTGSAAGINTIYSLPTASYDAVYIDYTIRSGSNARAGNFMAMWSGTSVNFTDTSITEFGSTLAFTFGAHVSGANMIVTGSAPTSGWTIKTILKAI